ncbi:zinc finger FYVE domain-containing protein 9 isoform X3 [Hydra vulgaris]|uniref:Zinc finger FYVE domain-containing protein 9 isoform X3 n=1 Tax=Hydra vulgaris TaxID=6087 RepID=A0ABM4C665_HYDVU
MDDLSNFALDKPWSPVSYFEEEEEILESEGFKNFSFSPTQLASLFESNINAVEHDLEKIRNLKEEYSYNGHNKIDESNDDDLSHYTLETENGLKVLETTYTINQKAIYHDFDRLKKLKAAAYEEDKKVLLSDKIDESLYTYKISPETSYLGDIKFDDLHYESKTKQKLMSLETTFDEKNVLGFLNSSISNLIQPIDMTNKHFNLSDDPSDYPLHKSSTEDELKKFSFENSNEHAIENDIDLLVEKAENIIVSFENENARNVVEINSDLPLKCSCTGSQNCQCSSETNIKLSCLSDKVSFDIKTSLENEELDKLLDDLETEMISTNNTYSSIDSIPDNNKNDNQVKSSTKTIIHSECNSSCNILEKLCSNTEETLKLLKEGKILTESCIKENHNNKELDIDLAAKANENAILSLSYDAPIRTYIKELYSNHDAVNQTFSAVVHEDVLTTTSIVPSSYQNEEIANLECLGSNLQDSSKECSIKTNDDALMTASKESVNSSFASNTACSDQMFEQECCEDILPHHENESLSLHTTIVDETQCELLNQQVDSSDSSSLNFIENEVVSLPSSSNQTRHVHFSLDAEQQAREEQHNHPVENNFVETSSVTSQIVQPQGSLGFFAPSWIPDTNTKTCMSCDTKFTVVKRRHHCRACGKVLCASCCNMKFNLPYMENKPARVCQICFDVMISGRTESSADLSLQSNFPISNAVQPFSEAPPPYSESVGGSQNEHHESDIPPYNEVGLPGTYNELSSNPASVLHEGGVSLTNTSLSSISGISSIPTLSSLPGYTPSVNRTRSPRNRSESEMSAVIMFNSAVTNLPPILRKDNEETRIVNNPDLPSLFNQMNDPTADSVPFMVNKNLVVKVKVVNLSCCTEKRCWCFASDGMGASNQEEIVIMITVGSSDLSDVLLIKKVLQQMNFIFEKAKQGHPVSDLEQLEFDNNIAFSQKSAGMLFFKSSLQCQKNLLIPTTPYLFGLYITSTEIPWAKNFPLRLLLRIGAEFKYYPCPLFNTLEREPVYAGIGETIVKLLADFRNFQYTIPRIAGVTINLRGKDTVLKLPQYRIDDIVKALNAAEDNVLSLAGNFSSTCDGHLVSVEKDGRYKTQTLSIVLKENRKVTCATFLVISAALKDNVDGIKAKASIIEDGVMIQVTADVMKELKTALKDIKEYQVRIGDQTDQANSSFFSVEWCGSENLDRPRLSSPIDGTSFENLTNMKIRHSYDYTSSNLTAKIHWVEVYFLPQDSDTVQRLSARELGQMTSSIAKACMSALSPHLMLLVGVGMTRIGLRINLAADYVEYRIGAAFSTLPPELLPTLDDKLVPAIHSVMANAQERVAVELIFQIVQIV